MKKITKRDVEYMVFESYTNKLFEEIDKNPEEEKKYEQIKQLSLVAEKIEGQVNNSLTHLNAFMSLGMKVRDSFEFKRAVAEISRIQTLIAYYQKVIVKCHEVAENDPSMQTEFASDQGNTDMKTQLEKKSNKVDEGDEGEEGSGVKGHETKNNIEIKKLKDEMMKVSKEIDNIVLQGGQVTLADPLSIKYARLKGKINVLKRGQNKSLKEGKELSIPEKHQLKIAYDTLKMNPAMARVMGGPSREEAIAIIKKLTGKDVKESKSIQKKEELLGNYKKTIEQYKKWKIESAEDAKKDPTIKFHPEYWDKLIKNAIPKVGDIRTSQVGAPGVGTVSEKVTRVDSNGNFYGYTVSNNSRILDPSEVIEFKTLFGFILKDETKDLSKNVEILALNEVEAIKEATSLYPFYEILKVVELNEGWAGAHLPKNVDKKKLIELLKTNGLKQAKDSLGPYNGDFWLEEDMIWYNDQNETKINRILELFNKKK